MGSTVILPAAVRYQTELAQNVATLKKAGVEPDTTLLEAGQHADFGADRRADGAEGGAG